MMPQKLWCPKRLLLPLVARTGHACSRLSQYIKEKKPIPHQYIEGLNVDVNVFPGEPTQDLDTTLDLFPGADLSRTCTSNPKMKRLTILYNGEVVNFHNIDAKKAEGIIAFASSVATLEKVEQLDISMPMARRTSLQRFLQKRKERINSSAPYSSSSSSSSKQASYDDDNSWLQLAL